ncbi:RsmD family RNA methyltransferase [uncultured Sutterella sp.]|uniref:RsmD family RNA methyltransferase n=1 Tax=uncultured Sutterella sp. TaxID=286133 RepID=UPI002616B70A|nr:RsmD family RNA methyltransferase [uncultured Sutterella sp.]
MRLVGGLWRRTPLAVADLGGLRPTPERVRETVFDWLRHLFGTFEGRSALDLFAGSGALGLEALSRGMAVLDAVELDRVQARNILQTVERLSAEENVRVHREDAFGFLGRTTESYDVIFIDPPFALNLQDEAIRRALPRLKNEGILYVERAGLRTAEALLDELGLVRLRSTSAGQVDCELLARKESLMAGLAREEKPSKKNMRRERSEEH